MNSPSPRSRLGPLKFHKLFFGALGFFVAFSFEIRVRAEVAELPNAKTIQEQPDQCLESSGVCALRTEAGEKYVLELGDDRDKPSVTVYMDQETALIRVSDKEIRLVKGTVWVQAESSFTVHSEFGDARIQKGDFWVKHQVHKIVISATGPKAGENVELFARGSSESLLIEPGMENWIASVGTNGKAETGLPTAIEFAPHLERWARLYPDKKQAFEKDVEKFKAVWQKASVHAAEIHRSLFERKVASVEFEQARKAEQRRKVEDHDRALREIFRKRVLGNE